MQIFNKIESFRPYHTPNLRTKFRLNPSTTFLDIVFTDRGENNVRPPSVVEVIKWLRICYKPGSRSCGKPGSRSCGNLFLGAGVVYPTCVALLLPVLRLMCLTCFGVGFVYQLYHSHPLCSINVFNLFWRAVWWGRQTALAIIH